MIGEQKQVDAPGQWAGSLRVSTRCMSDPRVHGAVVDVYII